MQRRAAGQRRSLEQRRLTPALLLSALLSLLLHMLLLSLTFGGQGLGLPGFGFPWQDRRIAVPDLRVAVVPAQVTPVVEPVLQAGVEQPVVRAPATTPSAFLASTSRRTATPMTPEASPRAVAKSTPAAATGVSSAKHPLGADRLGDTASPPVPAPDVIAVAPNDEATWSVPAEPPMPTPVVAATPGVSSVETAIPSSRDAGDAARAETAQLEAERPLPRRREQFLKREWRGESGVESKPPEARRQPTSTPGNCLARTVGATNNLVSSAP